MKICLTILLMFLLAFVLTLSDNAIQADPFNISNTSDSAPESLSPAVLDTSDTPITNEDEMTIGHRARTSVIVVEPAARP